MRNARRLTGKQISLGDVVVCELFFSDGGRLAGEREGNTEDEIKRRPPNIIILCIYSDGRYRAETIGNKMKMGTPPRPHTSCRTSEPAAHSIRLGRMNSRQEIGELKIKHYIRGVPNDNCRGKKSSCAPLTTSTLPPLVCRPKIVNRQ